MLRLLCVTLLLAVIINASSIGVSKSASASFAASGSAEDSGLLSFKNGNVGVNFGGYHASAGLGGLLTGNLADGGLHAEAGTPHGQSAGAGLGGTVDANGKAGGGLYAGASAGGGVGAGAGLSGASSASGSVGASYAGAVGGGGETHITKITHKTVPAVVHHKEVEIVEQAQPQTTYIERTVIPNYVEKKIQVPSYVEKTIRVPTTVEKTIRVPAAPTVIEKTVEAPAPAPEINIRGSYVSEVAAPETYHDYHVIQKTKVHHHPHHTRVRVKNVGYYGGGGGGGGAGGFSFGSGFGGGYGGYGGYGGGGYGGYGGHGGGGSSSFTVHKQVDGQLFNNIFNIPISTLGAVNKLVNGVVGGGGGASGSLSFSKSYSHY